ncbi:FISUMP domain-containing protein [uncultured Fibrobacter sp.]|uniref:FISUMP domain-containing protein n=1 Tax=uncultured Fibrobacter sp. TaxID=261512 RepID=UPI0025CFB16C|nr:FISUMP domain-containing protein [uncultured Fibrobacter sp.]
MNKFKTLLFLAVFSGIGLWGCDDSSSASSNGPDENAAVESSSSVRDADPADESSSSVDKKSSGNETKEKDKSSSSSVVSSSSKKVVSSSSDKETSSSSVKANSLESSSSSKKNESSSSSSVKQSSSSVKSSSSKTQNPWGTDSEWQPFNLASFEYGVYTDTREPDNVREYHYLTIYNKDHSDSLTVFAENLNIGKMVEFVDSNSYQVDDTMIEKFCYDNDSLNCHYYGGLYQWAEMMGFNDSCNTKSCAHLIEENHRGICPEGWRLMTYDDYKFVAQSENVVHNSYEDMRSSFGFNGYNATGFSLVPAGYIWSNGFKNLREATYFHYPAESVKFDANKFSRGGYAGMSGGGLNEQNTKKRYGFSVRCAMVTNKIGNN